MPMNISLIFLQIVTTLIFHLKIKVKSKSDKYWVNDEIRKSSSKLRDLYVKNVPIPKVKFSKFLGIFIEECLTWNTHCMHIISVLNKSWYLIRNLKTIDSSSAYFSVPRSRKFVFEIRPLFVGIFYHGTKYIYGAEENC